MTFKKVEKEELENGATYDIYTVDGDHWFDVTWIEAKNAFCGVWLLPQRYGPDIQHDRFFPIDEVAYIERRARADK